METKTINQKLLAFQSKVNAIKKDGKNPHFKSTYATLSQILSEVKPILSEVGLVLTQPVNNKSVQTIITDAETGESIMGEIPMPDNQNPQQIGSAITYYRRYLLAGILSLEIEDDDANAASTHQPRPEASKSDLPWLNLFTSKEKNALTKEGNHALAKLASGEITIETIKKHYRLSKEVEQYLIQNGVNANPIKD
jgi:hypothetical protein